MAAKSQQPKIPLPRSWETHAKSGILHIMAPAQYALTTVAVGRLTAATSGFG